MSRLRFFAFLFAVALPVGSPQARAQSNDNFADRLTLTGSHPTAVSNNLHATREAGEPDHAGAGAGRSLWFTWTAPTTGTVNIGTYETETSAPTMRAVAVYTGNALNSLTEVASSNNLAQLEYLEGFYPAGELPAGTSINVPVTAGTVYQIAVDALQAGWSPDDGTTVLAINTPPTILSAANATGTTGSAFSYAVVASGGSTTYAATGLPAGLVINAATGQITGTAAATGAYTVGLSAVGPGGTGTGTLTLRFSDPVAAVPAAPVIENAMSVLGYVGQAFSTYIEAAGSPTSYAASNLPPGLTLNTSTGTLSGTPTTAGVYSVPIAAGNAVGTSSATLTINITTPSLPVITSGLTASGVTGTSFTYYIDTNLDGYSGVAPTGWTATNLPPGLTLTAGSDYFSGTPTQAGIYPVAISATNSAGTRQAVVTVTITNPPAAAPVTTAPVLSSRAVAQGVVGTAFGYTLAATESPTSFGATNLPPGVTFTASTGVFAGTPTAAGTFLVPVTANNAYGTSTGTLTVTIFANSAAQSAANGLEKPVIVSPASAFGYVGQSLNYGITAEIEGSPYFYVNSGAWTFSASGLPPGLSVTTSSGGASGYGTISGTPTAVGTYQATITVTTPTGYPEPNPYSYSYESAYHLSSTGTAVVTFIVNAASASAAPFITGSAAVAATVGVSTSYYPAASSTSAVTYAAGGLPPGLSISAASNVVSGTPTAAGTYAATISATNAAGTGTATVTFIVAAPATPAPLFTGYATASGTVGTSFSYYLSASYSPTGYTVGNLPPGLSYSATGSYISGTPTQAGTYTVPISATNAAGTTNATLTITIYTAAAVAKPPSIDSDAIATGTTGQSFYYYIETDTSPTSYGVGGSLPPGLTFSTSNGSFGGTPTQAGTYTVPISATNAAGTTNATLTVVITNPGLPVFDTTCVLSGMLGQSFSSLVYASNNPTAYTFSGLPPGITQSPSSPGYLTGTPTQAGTYSVAVGATNVSGTATATLTITVTPSATAAPPVINSAAGASGYVGGAFTYPVQASGSPTSYAASGYPSGLSFSSSTGLLSGTPKTAGTYPIAISATNAGGTGQATVNLVVTAAAGGPVLITSAASINPQVNETFYYAITAGAPVTSFSATNLPTGVTLNTSTGLISGKLAAVGTYTVPITATGPSGTAGATLTIENAATYYSVATYPAAVSGLVNQAFSLTLTCNSSGATSTSASPLPAGLSCNYATGVISGTPKAVGTTRVTVEQNTSNGTWVNGTLLITIGSTAPTVPVISNAAGATAFLGLPFYYYLQATNSPTAFSAGGLPAGLTLNASTGLITGTPTAGGTYTVSLSAQNSSGSSSVASMSIYVADTSSVPAQVTSAAEVAGAVGAALSYTVANGANSLYYLSASGLPPGLSVGSYTNVISGTPTTAGTYVATVYPENSYGNSVTASVTFNITAAPTVVPTVTSAAAAAGSVGTAFSYTLTASEATTLTASNLPAGLSFNATTGLLSGTPTAAGSYTVPLTAANSIGTGSGTLSLTVAAQAAPTVSGSDLLEWTAAVGASSSNYIYANGSATSYGASGLPPGLSINMATGQVSGTPTAAGTYPVTVSVANSTGSAGAVITFVVSSSTPALPTIENLEAMFDSYVGESISTVYVSAGSPSTSYAAGGLPPGLSINNTSGQITGTPTTAGVYSVNLSASNAVGSATEVWTVVVHDDSVLYPAFSNLRAEISGTVGQSSDNSFYVYADYGNAITNAPVTLTVSGLPAGLQLSETGSNYFEFYGTPITAGAYPLTVTATAPGGATTTGSCLFVVSAAPAPTITSAAGALGNVNSAFSYSLTASNTVTAYTAGTLPAGLTLNTSTGVITGTPTTAGTTAVPVSAMSPYGNASAVVTIRIDPALYGGLPLITSAAAISSQDYLDEEEPSYYYPPYTGPALSYALTTLNGSATFTLGNLPTGLVFNPYTNTITGQPVAAGVFQVPVTATNAAGTVSATLTIISGAPLAIADPPLAQIGYVGGPYSGLFLILYPSLGTYSEQNEDPYFLYEDGGETEPVTFTAAGLPPGLSLNSYEGEITGTFTQAGTYPVTLTANNLAGAGSAVCTFTVAAGAPAGTGVTTAPGLSGQAQAAAFVGVPLSYYLDGSGTSSYAASGLPAGLVLNPSTGQITGNPTTVGIYTVTVSATNSAGTTQAVLTITVDAAPPAPVLEGGCAATATVGTAFYFYIDAYGYYSSLPAATGYAAGALPAGLSLNASTGEIMGTPTGPAGVYTIPVTASVGRVATLGGVLTLTIQNAPATATLPVMTSAAGALGLVDNPFAYTIYNAAFIPAAGSLPAGLSYNAANGVISGYPTTPGTSVVPLATAGTGSGSSVNRQKSVHRSMPADSGGTSLASALTICVLAPDLSLPRLTAQPVGGTTMEGSTFTFSAAAVGAPTPTYQWRHNGVIVPGVTGAALTLNAAQPTDSGAYTVTAVNTAGSATGSTVTLLVETTFAQWQNAYFSAQQIAAGLAADNADPSGDGVPNLLKYALDLDPNVPVGSGMLIGVSRGAGGSLQLTFMRDAGETDIDYIVEAASDLTAAASSGWTTVAEGDAGVAVAGVNAGASVTETAVTGTSRVQVTVQAVPPAGGGAQFLRLRIIRP